VNPQLTQKPTTLVDGSVEPSPPARGTGANSMTKRPLLRSIAAVALGFILTAALSVITDVILHAVRVFPPWAQQVPSGLLLLALLYRVIFTIAGGWVTARLAPNRTMKHVAILGALGTVAASIGAFATWNAGPQFGPHWYPLALIVTALPAVWIGGRLFLSRQSAT